MTRTVIPTRDEADQVAKPIFDATYKRLGFVPNLLRLTSLSPAVLTGLHNMQQALTQSLDQQTRSQIALVVSQTNRCLYCLATHTYMGMHFAHLSPEQMLKVRIGGATDELSAASHFAGRIVKTRGHVSAAEVTAVREAGFDDEKILEIVTLTAQYMFTNYINSVFDTKIDFPNAPSITKAGDV